MKTLLYTCKWCQYANINLTRILFIHNELSFQIHHLKEKKKKADLDLWLSCCFWIILKHHSWQQGSQTRIMLGPVLVLWSGKRVTATHKYYKEEQCSGLFYFHCYQWYKNASSCLYIFLYNTFLTVSAELSPLLWNCILFLDRHLASL